MLKKLVEENKIHLESSIESIDLENIQALSLEKED